MSNITYHPSILELIERFPKLPLALSDHPGIYLFSILVLEPSDIEFWGSPQDPLDNRLQLISGSTVDGQSIRIKGTSGQGAGSGCRRFEVSYHGRRRRERPAVEVGGISTPGNEIT
jgi:hypothetical protein